VSGPRLSDLLVERLGDDPISSRSKTGQLVRTKIGVRHTSEFRRIENLPRRIWERALDLSELTRLLTESLRAPEGAEPCGPECRCPRELRPIQAAAIRDLHDVKGALVPAGVGKGKTLISLLAPVVLEAKRPLLLVPAALRDQTLRKAIPMMKRHFWRLHPNLRIHSYTEVSLESKADLLEEIKPDLIICDEVHELKRRESARTRRVARYMQANPYTMFCGLSGSITQRSLKDYWHLLMWALKPDLAPLPAQWPELCEWADALDLDVPEEKRVAAGSLVRLTKPGESVRAAYRRRFTETPGVVATSDNELACSLLITRGGAQPTKPVQKMINALRDNWEDPNGDPMMEAKDIWRVVRQLALGFWMRWEPAAPPEWLFARQGWGRYVRETLRHNRRGLDSPLQVWNECAAMPKPPEEFLIWREVKDSFEPNPIAEWIDKSFAVNAAADWLKSAGGICWTEHVAFGRAVAERAGVPYFGAGDDHIVDASGPIVASVQAHGQGKNLQHWNRNLVVAPSPNGKTWEQLLGRTHREGQLADEVTCEVWLHVSELFDAFRQAIANARWIEETIGQRQKLCYADFAFEVT
jgi:hypothetical protein